MKKTKRYIILSLAAIIALSPMIVKANKNTTKEDLPIIAPAPEEDREDKKELNEKEGMDEQVEIPDYISYKGEIVSLERKEEFISMLVKDNKEEEFNGMLFHINEDVILLSDETKDFIKVEDLEVGMTVTGYYGKDTIMLMSLPPQLGPDLLVLNDSEEPSFILVSKFDENLLNSEGSLIINVSEDTIIIDKEGNKLNKEDIKNKDLIIFYDLVLESYPAKTSPEKIIRIDKKEFIELPEIEEPEVDEREILVLDKIIINDKDIKLDSPIYKSKEVNMVPLRQIGEALGYKVTWDNKERRAELTKGAQWTAVIIGKDNYNFARMLITLGKAPEIHNSKTYVPFSFLREVLKVDVDITEEGVIEIK